VNNPRDQSVIKDAKRRDQMCLRCGKVKNLHGHHMHALADGGPDTVENIATLCGVCHRDWHLTAESCISFQDFLETPSSECLLFYAINGGADDITLGALKRLVPMQRIMNFGLKAKVDAGGRVIFGGR